jgi:hypothetical protein
VSTGNVLTYLTESQITDAETEIDGKALTRPALLATDGAVLAYVVDVDVGKNVILRNVPIARNNRSLVFTDAGSAIRLRRTDSGRYEVVGLSNELPGTYTTFSVNLDDFTFGAVTDLTIVSRLLTYAELATVGGYGTIPYGAIGIFKGGVLLEIRS